MKCRLKTRFKKVNIWPYLLLTPALIIITIVIFIPVLNAILLSFQSYDLRRPKNIAFIGIDNYITVLNDALFWQSLLRTVIWVVFGVGFQFLLGFMLALLMNKRFIGRGVVRSLSLVPWVTPGVLIGLMWKWIFDGNYGVINDILLKMNIIYDAIPFLARKATVFPAVIATIIWQGIPFFSLMVLAGLQGIPEQLYEAANIDGATGLQKLFRITIPSLRNTIFVTTMLRIIWVTNSVDVIFNMTEGGPAYASQTLSIYIFNQGIAMNLGYASTMSILMTLCLLLVAIPYLKNIFKSQEG